MTYEQAAYFQLLLLCGHEEPLWQYVDTALSEQEPLQEVILALVSTGGDSKKALTALNQYIRQAPELDYDHGVFGMVMSFLQENYESKTLSLEEITNLMYRIAAASNRTMEEPWYTMDVLEALYNETKMGIIGLDAFLGVFHGFLYDYVCLTDAPPVEPEKLNGGDLHGLLAQKSPKQKYESKNRKWLWLVLPGAVLPYLVLAALGLTFLAPDIPLLDTIMETVFRNNALNLVGALLGYCLMAAGCSVGFFAVALGQKWDALALTKTAVTVKLCQIPAYIVIFVVGVVFFFSIFTFAFSLALVVLDGLALLLTGLLTVAAVIRADRQGICSVGDHIWVMVLQFVFCADVVSAAVFYRKLKKSVKN